MTGTGGPEAAASGEAPADLSPLIRDVSIVIVAKNEVHNLRRSLPTVRSQEPCAPPEVMVIDSGSSDGTQAFVSELAVGWPGLRLIEIASADFHHARTRNLGAKLAAGRLLVFLGGDAIPADGRWLAELVRPFAVEHSPAVVASYSRQAPSASANTSNRIRMTYNYPGASSVRHGCDGHSPKHRHAFSTVSCCIAREALADGPLFDEAYPVNEDTTLARRVVKSGGAIAYQAESVVVHSHNYSAGEVFRRYYDNCVTYRRLGIFGRGGSRVGADGAGLLQHARRELRGQPPMEWARFAAFYLAGGAGVVAGMLADWLPTRLRRHFSAHGV